MDGGPLVWAEVAAAAAPLAGICGGGASQLGHRVRGKMLRAAKAWWLPGRNAFAERRGRSAWDSACLAPTRDCRGGCCRPGRHAAPRRIDRCTREGYGSYPQHGDTYAKI